MERITLLLFLMAIEKFIYLFFKCERKGGKLEYFHQLSIGGIPVKSHLENYPDNSITSALKSPCK